MRKSTRILNSGKRSRRRGGFMILFSRLAPPHEKEFDCSTNMEVLLQEELSCSVPVVTLDFSFSFYSFYHYCLTTKTLDIIFVDDPRLPVPQTHLHEFLGRVL